MKTASNLTPDSHGKSAAMDPAAETLLRDEEIQQTGCGDWLYSHGNRFNRLYLDGHVHSVSVKCTP